MLDGMIAAYFAADAACQELWFTLHDEQPIGVAYRAPERMTSGTWNLYLIAVHPSRQSCGHGAAFMSHIEALLAQRGERVLLVETSGLPEFERTRAFYLRNGYTREAVIRDFYNAGEDKIVFHKALRSASPRT